MSKSLGIYLQDHLAGAAYAIDLVEFMRDQHKSEELGQFAAELLVDIKADQEILQQLADRAGAGSSTLKELTAWLSEKVSRLKLRHAAGDGLGIFEALEFLGLGINGKLALWRALQVIATVDPRLQGMNFQQLAARAEKQHAKVEKWRLEVAHTVFDTEALAHAGYTRNADSYDPLRGDGPRMRGKTITGGVLLAIAVVATIRLVPDVVRYLKIRAM